MRYLQRDETGKVVAHFANPQYRDEARTEPYAVEEVPDVHPDVVAYTAALKVARTAAKRTTIRELIARIAELERKTALLP